MLDALEQDDVRHMIELLAEQHLTVAVAEGDTGGVLLEWLTAVPGSSAVVLGGVVASHDDLKRTILGVPAPVIAEHGAVSPQVAEAMAHGIRRVATADV